MTIGGASSVGRVSISETPQGSDSIRNGAFFVVLQVAWKLLVESQQLW